MCGFWVRVHVLHATTNQPDSCTCMHLDDLSHIDPCVAGAFYMRLVGRPLEVYQYLEPLYNDYRKVYHNHCYPHQLEPWKCSVHCSFDPHSTEQHVGRTDNILRLQPSAFPLTYACVLCRYECSYQMGALPSLTWMKWWMICWERTTCLT
jgi:hypothetical protein